MPRRPAVVCDALEDRRLFATLVAGVTAGTTVAASSPQKNWTIDLKAGQAVFLSAGESASSSFKPQLILIAPNGKTLARSVGDTGAFIGKAAPVSGTYVVRLRDANAATARADVTVTAFYTGARTIADGDDGGTAVSGRRFAATIGPGDLDVWRIDGTAGQFLSIVANENNNNDPVGVGVALVGPDGSGIRGVESEAGVTDERKLTATGTYYAVVYEPGANATGRYGFSIGLAPGVQTTEDVETQQPLTGQTPRTGDLPSGDTDVFRIDLGRRVDLSIDIVRTGGTTTPNVYVVDPNGDKIGYIYNNTGENADGPERMSYAATSSVAGTYYLYVENSVPSTGGAYRLTYRTA